MTEIRRDTLFSKLNPLAYQTVEAAALFCKLRRHPYVELVHWIHQLQEQRESDFSIILEASRVDRAQLSKDIESSLQRLPRGATSMQDLSPRIDQLVERAYLFGSLAFGQAQVRTGHLLLAALKTPELRQAFVGISAQFERLSADELAAQFDALLGRAPESSLSRSLDAPPPQDEPAAAVSGAHATALQRYAVDLTARARAGELDPVVGREAELRQVIDILMRRRQNNPILTGEAGVGKTAVVESLALRIAQGDVPAPLKHVALYALDLGLLAAGASMRGEFEQRLRQVIDEVQASTRPIILFIDEAHTLIGAGGAAGTGDAANLLKPALARGKLRTIAATTWAEYKKHIEKDPALTRRFQVVQVDEPDEASALRMVRSMADALEAHHGVHLQDEALEAAVKLSKRYIPARQLPDKAVSLLDTACARVAVSQKAPPAEMEDSRKLLEALAQELALLQREAALGHDVEARIARARKQHTSEAQRLQTLQQRWEAERALVQRVVELERRLRTGRDREAEREQLADLRAQLRAFQGDNPLLLSSVDALAIGRIVSDWTGIPLGRMVRDEARAVLDLSSTLGKRVIGQRHALDRIAQRIKTTRAGLEDPRKPIGVFLLAGPSGVGKTETALALAEALYGGEHNLITVNMSEFQESHTVSTLKGAPPGYIGYGEGGVLTEAVRRKPYSVVLLDEVEKAHPDVHEIFFQVFDKGHLEDSEGRAIDFRNTLILLTTNTGSELLEQMCRDAQQELDLDQLNAALRGPLLTVFPPALLGRMQTLPYLPLTDAQLSSIVRLQLDRVTARVRERYEIPLEYDDAVVQLLVARCTERQSGARMVEALLADSVLPRLSEAFLGGVLHGTQYARIALTVEAAELTYRFLAPETPLAGSPWPSAAE